MRQSIADFARCFDAAAVNQADVHDDHVGSCPLGFAHCLLHGFRFGHDAYVVGSHKHGFDAAADNLVASTSMTRRHVMGPSTMSATA